MGILEEIREYFASTQNGAREIKTLPKEYSAMVIRDNEGYGVAIEFDDIRDISEKFANSRLFSRTLAIGGIEKKYLILSCMLDSLRYEFATVCAQFVEPGIDGMDRKNLMSEPLEWWKKWRELMGNTISNKEAYSVIAEMMVLDDLYTQDNTVEWTAVNSGSHDIEGNESSYEVKSTVKRYGATITISGQHQLQSLKRLQLYFCRLEQSRTGISINDMKDRLVADGYDKDKIESLGLLKMDLLGLRTLTVIGDAIKFIYETTGDKLDIDKIPLDDEATCSMLRKGDTQGGISA